MNSRVVMLNNIPSPYSVDLFSCLQETYTEYELYFIFTNTNEDNRNWKLEEGKLKNVIFLKSKVLKLKTAYDHRYIHFPENIKKELDRIDPAVVIAKEYNPSALKSLSWCKKHHRKYVHVTEGTLNSERNLNFIQKYSRKKIITNADYCLGASTKSKEKLLYWGANESKTDIAYLTFDLSAYKEIKPEPVPGRLLYVGSLVERKGLDLLIKALPYAPSVKELRIVGDGTSEEKEQLLKLAEEYGVEDKIVLLGYKQGDDLLNEYRHAKAFVLPAREDCFGLVLLEAMVSKVPIIASKYADGAYDIVIPNENGKIEDPYVANHFGDAIERVMTETKYKDNAETADCSRFELSEVAEVYQSIINKLTNE